MRVQGLATDISLVRDAPELDLDEGISRITRPVHHGQVPPRQHLHLDLPRHFHTHLTLKQQFYTPILLLRQHYTVYYHVFHTRLALPKLSNQTENTT